MLSFEYKSDSQCLFCKIVEGKIPATKIYSDSHCIVFLDINPVNHGHVLIVPRHHHKDLTKLPSNIASHVASIIPAIANALMIATKADGLNLIVNNGIVAGQTIFHGHWHLIPRFTDDSVNWPWPQNTYVGDEMNQVAFAIGRELCHLIKNQPEADLSE